MSDTDDENVRLYDDPDEREPAPPDDDEDGVEAMAKRMGALGSRKRVTTAEKAARVAIVAEMLTSGFRQADVVQFIRQKLDEKWGHPSDRHIERLCIAARQFIRDNSHRDLDEERGKTVARLDYLYRQAVKAKYWSTAARIQKQITEFHGLNAPIKLRHGNDPENQLPVPPGATNFVVLVQEVREE